MIIEDLLVQSCNCTALLHSYQYQYATYCMSQLSLGLFLGFILSWMWWYVENKIGWDELTKKLKVRKRK